MALDLKESDWKLFRRLHSVALERFCQQVIEDINQSTSNCTGDYHQRYLAVFNLIMDRNEQMARAFNDSRRSKAIVLLTSIRELGLLTDEEFSQFSPDTRASVESVLEIRRR